MITKAHKTLARYARITSTTPTGAALLQQQRRI